MPAAQQSLRSRPFDDGDEPAIVPLNPPPMPVTNVAAEQCHTVGTMLALDAGVQHPA